MDDGSVRGSVVTASAASSSIATSASTTRTNSVTATATATGTATGTTGLGTAAYSCSQSTSPTASLDRMGMGLDEQEDRQRDEDAPVDVGEASDTFENLEGEDPLDPLAARMFQDDSQGSQVVLPGAAKRRPDCGAAEPRVHCAARNVRRLFLCPVVHVEAGTDPVAELGEDLDLGKQGRLPPGVAEWTGRSRKRRSRDVRKRLPTRYRVPLHEYHPTLQALQG